MAMTMPDRAMSWWTASTMPPMTMAGAATSIVNTRTAKVLDLLRRRWWPG